MDPINLDSYKIKFSSEVNKKQIDLTLVLHDFYSIVHLIHLWDDKDLLTPSNPDVRPERASEWSVLMIWLTDARS